MKAYKISLIHALSLFVLGAWGYLGSESPSPTALIPVIFGIAIIALNRGLKKENKAAAHVVVILTVLVLGGLIKPLTGGLERGDGLAIARVSVMLILSVLALIAFVKSFIDARKK